MGKEAMGEAAMGEAAMGEAAMLEFRAVTKRFAAHGAKRRDLVPAVRALSLTVGAGEIVAVVGQSGAGKSTVGRLALGLERADEGSVLIAGSDVARWRPRDRQRARRETHLIFQDPYEALHPGMRLGHIVAEPVRHLPRGQRHQRVREALNEVRLSPAEEYVARYPHHLSGGGRQRVAFARALIGRPRLVIADEPVSMLDVSLQAGLLRLVEDMRQRHGMTILFITHDLAVAHHVADRIAVVHRGQLLEQGPSSAVVGHPQHPYTRVLLRAAEHSEPPEEEHPPFPPGGHPCERHGSCRAQDPACCRAPAVHRATTAEHTYAVHATQ